MRINPISMTIADYCAAFDRSEVRVDRTYQRSPSVWPKPARSYLIETVLKGFPMPKLALHQVTDLKSQRTIKYVVDGQQRTLALRAFFDNDLVLSPKSELSEAAGRKYSQLPPDLQSNFLSYLLQFDQFEASGEEDVREYFRRINSFTAPLNPEEQRHARFQGPMKWFVHRITERYGETLVNLRVLPKQSVVRMADAKLVAEIFHALLNGVTTTTKTKLDNMYKAYDKGEEVPDEAVMKAAIDDAFDTLLKFEKLPGTALVRTNVFYSLLLALILVQKSWSALLDISPQSVNQELSEAAEGNLLDLAAILNEPELHPDYREFTKAAGEKTNVKAQRETRIKWLARALTESSI